MKCTLAPRPRFLGPSIGRAWAIDRASRLIRRVYRRRAEIATSYDRAFSGHDAFIPYGVRAERSSARHLYPLRLNLDALSIDRARFIAGLKERGVGASVHFIPLYRFTQYAKMGFAAADYPSCEWVFERELSLPIYPGMETAEIERVIEAVLDLAKTFKR